MLNGVIFVLTWIHNLFFPNDEIEEIDLLIEEENIKRLREKFKEVDIVANENYFLRRACCKGKLKVVKLLDEFGVDLMYDDNMALYICAEKGHLELIKYLWQKGSCLDHQQGVVYTAGTHGHADVLYFLLEKIAYDDKVYEEIFKNAAVVGNREVLQLLYEKGGVDDKIKNELFYSCVDAGNIDSCFLLMALKDEKELYKYWSEKILAKTIERIDEV